MVLGVGTPPPPPPSAPPKKRKETKLQAENPHPLHPKAVKSDANLQNFIGEGGMKQAAFAQHRAGAPAHQGVHGALPAIE